MQCSWSSQHTYPKAQNTVKEWGEWGAPLTSGDFGGIGLRPWFERPLSLFDTFHTGGPAGIWDKPCGLKPCGVAVTFLQSDQATRSVYGMLVSTQTVTHSVRTSSGVLTSGLGVDLKPGVQEQCSETTDFNLSHVMLSPWVISHAFLGSDRPEETDLERVSWQSIVKGNTGWSFQGWNFVGCQYWIKKE